MTLPTQAVCSFTLGRHLVGQSFPDLCKYEHNSVANQMESLPERTDTVSQADVENCPATCRLQK